MRNCYYLRVVLAVEYVRLLLVYKQDIYLILWNNSLRGDLHGENHTVFNCYNRLSDHTDSCGNPHRRATDGERRTSAGRYPGFTWATNLKWTVLAPGPGQDVIVDRIDVERVATDVRTEEFPTSTANHHNITSRSSSDHTTRKWSDNYFQRVYDPRSANV